MRLCLQITSNEFSTLYFILQGSFYTLKLNVHIINIITKKKRANVTLIMKSNGDVSFQAV